MYVFSHHNKLQQQEVHIEDRQGKNQRKENVRKKREKKRKGVIDDALGDTGALCAPLTEIVSVCVRARTEHRGVVIESNQSIRDWLRGCKTE